MQYYFQCPKCRSDEQFVRPSAQADSVGCSLLVFGGIVPALIFADYKGRRVQCAKGAHIFRQPALPKSPLTSFADWIVLMCILATAVAALFFVSENLASLLPSLPVLAAIEEAVAAQPRVAAYLLASLLILIIIPAVIVGRFSNFRFRKQLSTEYRLKPLLSDKFSEQNSARFAAREDPGGKAGDT